MTVTTVATLAIAAMAVLGAIGSVLLLSFRVGRLIGTLDGYMTSATEDRAHIWRELGALTQRFYDHATAHSGQPGVEHHVG